MICFDIDGVLAKYVKEDYKDENGVENYKFLRPHYFLERDEDPFGIALINMCIDYFPSDTFIVTGVTPDLKYRNKIVIDKINWVDIKIPKLDIGTKFMATSSPKTEFIENIRGCSLTKRDILFDDYNKNLYAWLSRGGSAIKFRNEHNSDWSGKQVMSNILTGKSMNDALQDAFNVIVDILSN